MLTDRPSLPLLTSIFPSDVQTSLAQSRHLSEFADRAGTALGVRGWPDTTCQCFDDRICQLLSTNEISPKHGLCGSYLTYFRCCHHRPRCGAARPAGQGSSFCARQGQWHVVVRVVRVWLSTSCPSASFLVALFFFFYFQLTTTVSTEKEAETKLNLFPSWHGGWGPPGD